MNNELRDVCAHIFENTVNLTELCVDMEMLGPINNNSMARVIEQMDKVWKSLGKQHKIRFGGYL